MEEFGSVKELYHRVKPALKSKMYEMHRDGFEYIKEEDIWNYLKEQKWIHSVNLNLSEMVSDILQTDNHEIDNYFKIKAKQTRRRANLDE